MHTYSGPSGEALVAIATLVSLQIAEGKTADQLGLIAAFFEVLGDNLALLAVGRTAAGTRREAQPPAAGQGAGGSTAPPPQKGAPQHTKATQ